MAEIYVDTMGNEWYAAEIKQGTVPIEVGDYVLFNSNNGFRVVLRHLFLEEFGLLHKEDSLDIPKVVAVDDEKK
jgi:hypothetical protein